jgi:hypothetical protein
MSERIQQGISDSPQTRIPEGWQPARDKDGNASRYAITRGKWTICKVFYAHLGDFRYELWPGQITGFPTGEKAAQEADRLDADDARGAASEGAAAVSSAGTGDASA